VGLIVKMCNLLFHSSSSFSSLSSLFKMLQFFQRHEINKMHKTPIVSLIFTFLFSLFFTWAALPLSICLFAFAEGKAATGE